MSGLQKIEMKIGFMQGRFLPLVDKGNSRLALARDESKFESLKDQTIEAVRNGLVNLD